MKREILQMLFLMVLVWGIMLFIHAQSVDANTQQTEMKKSETTLQDQTDIAVTIYNNDRALIRERRKIKLPRGESSLKFMDVPERIIPETVCLKSLSQPGSLQILEQNYEYDLISPSKLMEKYVGKEVKLINKNRDMDFYEVTAKLLSVNESPVFQVDNQIYLGHPGNVVLPELPAELIAKPTLVWLLDNDLEAQELEASYLTSGISWKADYVLVYDEPKNSMDLEGWITLNNNSGATYQNAKLKLVAGEVNIVPPMAPAPMMDRMMVGVAKSMEVREESFAEYHLYTVPRRTTIKQNQSKQVSLLSAQGVKANKIYEYRGNTSFYHDRINPIRNENIDAFLMFRNAENNQLGVPLPEGVIRVYQEDSEGMLQFSGEDRIKHTPKDEEVRLRLGKAFDIIGERTQTDFQKLGPTIVECEFEITIRNHKKNDITVDIVEPMIGDWQIVKSSMDYEKKDAFSIIFHLPVKAESAGDVSYRVRIRF